MIFIFRSVKDANPIQIFSMYKTIPTEVKPIKAHTSTSLCAQKAHMHQQVDKPEVAFHMKIAMILSPYQIVNWIIE